MTGARDRIAIERYARATRIAHVLLDLPAHECDAALARECADDGLLREEVDWMLRAARSDMEDDRDHALVPDTLLALDGTVLAALAPREYRILRPLGEGGTGMVYLAERFEDELCQRVALKLLRFSAFAGSRRFREEQRILAGLHHENIAHFVDAGELANGQPFLAVEYVDGETIDSWCARQPLAARIEVFLKVSSAVSHAHAQLVIHRDLKPANILVTNAGVPKLLDFGIARLLDTEDARTLTATGALTPVYASPEQIEGNILSTATDVYSLGAVLYEITSGVRPFHDCKSDMALLQAVVSGELTPPSRLGHVPADVEAIILKAMRRESEHRYASVAEFADDLRRYLTSQPVRARHGSLAYRVHRFAWRKRYALVAAVGAILMLSAFVAVTLLDLWRVQAQRERADRINQFFNSVLASVDPADMGRSATIVDALDRAQQRAEHELRDDPSSAMLTELTLAQTFQQLGRYDNAMQSAERAVEAAQLAHDMAFEIEARLVLGTTFWNQGKYAEATTALMQARALAERSGSAQQRGEIANRIGEVEFSAGRPDAARIWQQQALDVLPKGAIKARAYALGDLASIEYRKGETARALELNAGSIALLRRDRPRGQLALATQLSNRGAMLTRLRRYLDANQVLEESLAMKIELYGESHRIVVDALTKLAQLRIDQGDLDGALGYATRAYTLAKPMGNYVTARAAKKYAITLGSLQRDAEALPIAREAVALYRERYEPSYDELLDAQSILGWLEARAGDVSAGREQMQQAYQNLASKSGEGGFTADAKRRLDEIESPTVPTGQSRP